MKRLLSSQFIRWIGIAVTALSVGLVAWSLYTSDLLTSDAWRRVDVIEGTMISVLIYVPSLFCVSTAWYLLVMSVAKTRITWLDGLYIYALSAIYRYIPSNVVHYVGRYYMMRQRGVEHAAVAWGIIAETALLLAASTIVALAFGAPLIREGLFRVVHEDWLIVLVVLLTALSLFAIAILLLLRSDALMALISPFLHVGVFRAGAESFLLYVAARLISGASLYLISKMIGVVQLSLPDMIAIGSAAWTLGYITPGASAGLGVREAIIIAALIGLGVSTADATLVAIAFRVATTVADLIFTASGWAAHQLSGPAQASDRHS